MQWTILTIVLSFMGNSIGPKMVLNGMFYIICFARVHWVSSFFSLRVFNPETGNINANVISYYGNYSNAHVTQFSPY